MSILSWKDELLKRKLQKPKKGDSDWQKEGQYTAEIARLKDIKDKGSKDVKQRSKKDVEENEDSTKDTDAYKFYAAFSGDVSTRISNVKGDEGRKFEGWRLDESVYAGKEGSQLPNDYTEAKEEYLEKLDSLEEKYRAKAISVTVKRTSEWIDKIGITDKTNQDRLLSLWSKWDKATQKQVEERIARFNKKLDAEIARREKVSVLYQTPLGVSFIEELVDGKFEARKKQELEDDNIDLDEQKREISADDDLNDVEKEEDLLSIDKDIEYNNGLLVDLVTITTYLTNIREKLEDATPLIEHQKTLTDKHEYNMEYAKRKLFNTVYRKEIVTYIEDEIELLESNKKTDENAKPKKDEGMYGDKSIGERNKDTTTMTASMRTLIGELKTEIESYLNKTDGVDEERLQDLLGNMFAEQKTPKKEEKQKTSTIGKADIEDKFKGMSKEQLVVARPKKIEEPVKPKISNLRTDEEKNTINAEYERDLKEHKIYKKEYRKWASSFVKAQTKIDSELIKDYVTKLNEINEIKNGKPIDKELLQYMNKLLYLLDSAKSLAPNVEKIKTLLHGDGRKPKEPKKGEKAIALTPLENTRSVGLTGVLSTISSKAGKQLSIPMVTIGKFQSIAKETTTILENSMNLTWDSKNIKILLGKNNSNTFPVLIGIAKGSSDGGGPAYSYLWNNRNNVFTSKTKDEEQFNSDGEIVIDQYYNDTYKNYGKLKAAIDTAREKLNEKKEGMEGTLIEHILSQGKAKKSFREVVEAANAFNRSKIKLTRFNTLISKPLTKPDFKTHSKTYPLPKAYLGMVELIENTIELTKDNRDTQEELNEVEKFNFDATIKQLDSYITESEKKEKEGALEQPDRPKKLDKKKATDKAKEQWKAQTEIHDKWVAEQKSFENYKSLLLQMIENIEEFTGDFTILLAEEEEEEEETRESVYGENQEEQSSGTATTDGGK